jgi:hypothetical protein
MKQAMISSFIILFNLLVVKIIAAISSFKQYFRKKRYQIEHDHNSSKDFHNMSFTP